ncbi:hypothetical protein [Demequina sp. NBRC 110054]|uniref:hypothetical protein n=1 Tax=Demequina sp. NBRC 110054 TaxID=1570343 RepID=UPI00117789B7|nr:hypothetical protein [Demequina sp. NBRC 110054]
MSAVMTEAWLWLLVAFILGVIVGYYLRRYTVGGHVVSAPDERAAEAPAAVEDTPDEAPSADGGPDESESSEDVVTADTEPADEAVEEPMSPSAPAPAPAVETVAQTADEPEPESEPVSRTAATEPQREDVDVDTLGEAVSTFASLSTSPGAAKRRSAAPKPESEPAAEAAADPESVVEATHPEAAEAETPHAEHAAPAHASRRRRGRHAPKVESPYGSYGGADTGSVFVPEIEALQVPLGRREAEAAKSAQSGEDKPATTDPEGKPTTDA